MKITLLSFDLSHNCLGRAYLLAKVLERRYEIEIIGPTFGKGIWNPVDTGEFHYKSVPGVMYPFFLSSINKILRSISCDVIYAIKPRPTSYGIGILKKIQSKLPLILDIDDWELGFCQNIKSKIRLSDPNSFLYTWLMEKSTFLADEITVSSTFLQKKFGGNIVIHGRDTNAFDPSRFNRDSLREKWDLNSKKVVMFLGTPSQHKGLEDVINALISLNRRDIIFLVVGAQDDSYTCHLKELGGNRIKLIGMQPFHKVPEFLSMADLVVLPQHKSDNAIGQVPAKVFDAMAMAKPIIASRVSDLPEILDGCGMIVEPSDIEGLSECINYILDNEKEAQIIGSNAREKCIKEYSFDAIENVLTGIFDKYA
ncbi:MAG: glycosyltransferase family 4 protein [Candidatus Methanoperedens sp.]|nr:glycosyltransferase family 4 protein [Candidatus Methanoperedens sp.]